MNDVNIFDIELERQKKLEEYGLNEENIANSKEKIKIVSAEEKNRLGQELFQLISKKGYNDEEDIEEALLLIELGADVNYKNEKKGDYALLICARKNYLKTFIALLKFGANINEQNNYLTTATMAAARHGNKEMLMMLILLGADINARCLDGDNAIMSAKRHHMYDCLNILVNYNAYLTNRNCQNKTVLSINSDNERLTDRFLKHDVLSPTENINIIKNSYHFQNQIQSTTDEQDVLSLIEEATNKMNEINNSNITNNLENSTNQNIKRKTFSRIQ